MKITIFTTSRADFGHLRHLVEKLNKSSKIEVNLLIIEVRNNREKFFSKSLLQGLPVSYHYKIIKSSTKKYVGMIKVFATILIFSGKFFKKHQTDWVLVLGDRFETLSIALAAYISRIKIAHIHGGETSLGSLDHGFRNAITHFANLHFASTKNHQNRILEMLGTSQHVYNVGALAVENIKKHRLKSNALIMHQGEKINYEKNNFLLVTFHPVSTQIDKGLYELKILLEDLQKFGMRIISTAANADPGGFEINSVVKKCLKNQILHGNFYTNLGFENYINLMQNSFAVVGNSSSVLIEAPIVGIASLDFGSRQFGRAAPNSVFRIQPKKGAVLSVLKSIKSNHRQPTLFYGHGNTSDEITKIFERLAK